MSDCVIFQVPPKVSGKCTNIIEGADIPEWRFTVPIGMNIDFTNVNTTVELEMFYFDRKVLMISKGNGITVEGPQVILINRILGTNNTLPSGTSRGRLHINAQDGKVYKFLLVEYTITADE